MKVVNTISTVVEKCASCYSKELKELYKFGKVPLAGYFPFPGKENENFLLEMNLLKCNSCKLVQISPNVDDKLLFEDYRYASGFSMKNHFRELSDYIKEKVKLPLKSRILEIGCNDGTLMSFLRSMGFEIQGIDASKNVTKYALDKGLKVQIDFFSLEVLKKNNWEKKFDMIISTNSFAHVSKLNEIAESISICLKNNGLLLLEVQSWPEIVRNSTFDFVYHEHKYYYDLSSLNKLLLKYNLFMEEVTTISSHGGSYRILFRKIERGNQASRNESLNLAHNEVSPSETQIEKAINLFFQNISYLKKKLDEYNRQHLRIIGFGASGRANMLAEYLKPAGLMSSIYDESPERIGRYLGFSKILVSDLLQLKSSDYDVVVVLAWNFFADIKEKWPHQKKKLIQPLPTFREYLT